MFGGHCEPSLVTGYRGAYLPTKNHGFSFAELGMGTDLGNLPNHAKIIVVNPATHRKHKLEKNDIGAGGNSVTGYVPRRGTHTYTRSIDEYGPAADYLNGGSCSYTGVVLWRRVIH